MTIGFFALAVIEILYLFHATANLEVVIIPIVDAELSHIILLVMLTLFVQTGLADGAFKDIRRGLSALSLSGNPQGFDISTELPPMPFSATANVVREDSAVRSQYHTDYEWQVWSYSSCSGFSLEMVINAYGHHYIVADFLEKEYNLGVWNVAEGLTGGEPALAERPRPVQAGRGRKAGRQRPRGVGGLARLGRGERLAQHRPRR